MDSLRWNLPVEKIKKSIRSIQYGIILIFLLIPHEITGEDRRKKLSVGCKGAVKYKKQS